mmetsp:Transcript_58141/g.126418  ORF Transcript_58141/g.126418 Transcript_58141/m.126418 type:complete len:259 (-) Transcript_58141:13-789(-)
MKSSTGGSVLSSSVSARAPAIALICLASSAMRSRRCASSSRLAMPSRSPEGSGAVVSSSSAARALSMAPRSSAPGSRPRLAAHSSCGLHCASRRASRLPPERPSTKLPSPVWKDALTSARTNLSGLRTGLARARPRGWPSTAAVRSSREAPCGGTFPPAGYLRPVYGCRVVTHEAAIFSSGARASRLRAGGCTRPGPWKRGASQTADQREKRAQACGGIGTPRAPPAVELAEAPMVVWRACTPRRVRFLVEVWRVVAA